MWQREKKGEKRKVITMPNGGERTLLGPRFDDQAKVYKSFT
jgi:hypothetical protein